MSSIGIRLLWLAGAMLAQVPSPAMAGGNCNDPWVTEALGAVRQTPDGGNSGNCNINRYGGGSWGSKQELFTRVSSSFSCRDPWIGQVFKFTYNRLPSGNGDTGECNPQLYGDGNWSSYMDLSGKVKITIDALNSRGARIDASGRLINANNNRVIAPRINIVPAGVIANGGANVIGYGGANFAPIPIAGGKAIAFGGAN